MLRSWLVLWWWRWSIRRGMVDAITEPIHQTPTIMVGVWCSPGGESAFPAPLRGKPDSSPAFRPGHPPEILVNADALASPTTHSGLP